jgi:hypothetical protein
VYTHSYPRFKGSATSSEMKMGDISNGAHYMFSLTSGRKRFKKELKIASGRGTARVGGTLGSYNTCLAKSDDETS